MTVTVDMEDLMRLVRLWRAEARRHEDAARECLPEDYAEAILHRVEAQRLDECADELAALPPVIPATETHGG